MKASITPIAAAIQIALLAMPIQAHAQAKADEAEKASPQQLEMVVVTAQKRLQKGQDVPISMTVVPAATLEQRGVADPLSLSLVAPTLQVGDSNAYSLRGIGTLNTGGNQLLEGAVATSIDGVNMSRPQMANLQFADVERVEVLNGPQGTLFGKNATAGLINITTTKPVLDSTEGRVRLDFQHRTSGAEGNGVVAQAVFNTPISADSALRINAYGTHQQPLVSQFGPSNNGTDLGEQQYGAKLKYLWHATPGLSVYLIADYTDRKGAAGNPMGRVRRSFGPGSISAASVPPEVVVSPSNTVIAIDGPTDYRFRSQGLQAEVEYELGGGYSLVNILAHRSFNEFGVQDGDGTPVNFLSTIQTDFKFKQDSNELRLLTPSGGRFEGQAGLFLFRSKTDGGILMHGQLGLPGPVVPGTAYNIGGIANNKLTSTSSALFGQGTYKLTGSLRALLGMRYTRERLTLDLSQDATPFGLAPLFAPTLAVTQQARDNNFTYKAGLQYDLDRDVMTYVTLARGAKGPGFNSAVGGTAGLTQLAVAPETVQSFELGLKSAWLNRRLMFNGSLFNQNYTNLQAQTFNQTLQAFVTQNAGKSRSRGAEAQIQAKPDANWLLGLSAVLLDAKFTSFTGAQCYTGQPAQNPAAGTCDASGQRLPNAPRLTYTADVQYKHGVGSGMNASYDFNFYHRTGVNFGIGGDPGMAVGSASLLGASASLASASGAWKVSLYCRNCTDKRVPMSISPDALDSAQANVASYLQQFGYTSFRTVGVTAEYRF